jgi:hypothetical protein
MAKETTLVLRGLWKDDQLELREELAGVPLLFEDDQVPDGAVGDLGLSAAVIVLSTIAFKGLVAYLTLHHGQEEFEERIEIRQGDMTFTRVVKRRTAQPVDAALAAELSSVPGLDLSALMSQP